MSKVTLQGLFILSPAAWACAAALAVPHEGEPLALSIQWRDASQLEVSWRAEDTRWQLEATPDLATGAAWIPVEVTPPTPAGVHQVVIEPTDHARFFRLRRDPGTWLPPDPGSVAPPLEETGLTSFGEATEFLYEGDQPIQTGVATNAIATDRAAVLRGRVRDGSGQPLPAVQIRVHQRPEFGSTLTRADGAFDLVVNGGGDFTVVYELSGYLPAQRKVRTTANRYCWLPPVRLLAQETTGTPVVGAQEGPQLIPSRRVADADGERQAVLLVPSGTRAGLEDADGSVRPVDQLTVRVTEYTVGPGGPEAMPAILPTASGYTYAVEFSADEALAAGARQVRFDQPLYHYVENFAGFPVGTPVPAGYFDREQDQWIPAPNGRVIAVVGISGGLADLDMDGDSLADSPDQWAGLGLTDEERRTLAGLYAPGQSLWRVPVPHFSPWDYNWPYGPPADATPPDLDPEDEDPTEEDPCEQAGSSIIECQTQVLGERVAIPGTPFALNYRSNRQPGYRAAYSRRIPLSNSSLPPSVKAIYLDLQVAGLRSEQQFEPAVGLAFDFTWDGRDAYGRATPGAQPFLARIGYGYDAVYYEPGGLEAAFGAPGTVPMEGVPARQEAILWQEIAGQLGPMDANVAGLGGWTLSAQHWYDALAGRLYRGDGRTRKVSPSAAAGYRLEYYFGYCLDLPFPGLPFSVCPTLRRSDGPMPIYDLQVASDNSLYLYEPVGADAAARVIRVTESGLIQTVAGGGRPADGRGDGGPATEAQLGIGFLGGLALGADGSLFITHVDLIEDGGSRFLDGRVRRVAPDGVISTFAGGGRPSDDLGDGGLAIEARLTMPVKLAVGPDGSVYISDHEQRRVRCVRPDGVITTVAGTGETTSEPPEGVPAIEAPFDDGPGALAIDPAGNLFVADGERIRCVAPDGRIATYAGGGRDGAILGDRGPSSLAVLDSPQSLALDTQGNLYLADAGAGRVRVINPAGVIFTLAGGGDCVPHEPGCDITRPTEARLEPTVIAVRGDGSVFLVSHLYAVYRLAPDVSGSQFTVASEDAWELDRFDLAGRHLDTVHTLTGTAIRQLEYDAHGRLIQVREGPERVTTIVRDLAGRPTEILAPEGLRTRLELDAGDRLGRLILPGDRTYQFEYDPGGLLTQVIDPGGGVSRYTYDADGRLTRAEDAAGGFRTLKRTPLERGHRVVMTTAEGTVIQYDVTTRDTGVVELSNRFAEGVRHQVLVHADERRETQYADGSSSKEEWHPDPRWGMQAAFLGEYSYRTPGGLHFQVSQRRSVALPDPYDPLGLAGYDYEFTVSGDRYHFAFDPVARTLVETSPEGRRRTLILDASGRVTSAQLGDLAPVTFWYNPRGHLQEIRQGEAGNQRSLTLRYDENGLLSSLTDPLGNSTGYRYAATGFLRAMQLPDGAEVQLAFGPSFDLLHLINPLGRTHDFAYSPVRLLNQYEPPRVGPESEALHYGYDRDRRLVQVLTANGEAMEVGYDDLGRPAFRRDATGEARFTYSPTTGLLERLEGPQGVTLQRVYDGPFLVEESWSGPFEARVRAAYNSRLLRRSVAVEGVVDIAFSYDADGLLVAAGDLHLDRDTATGRPIRSRLDRLTTTYQYDAFGWLAAQAVTSPGGELYTAGYRRDPLGRITDVEETILGESHAFHHEYDARGRLVRTDRDGTPHHLYEYDANDNRTRVVTEGIETTAQYDVGDRLLSAGVDVFDHDRAGRLVRRTSAGTVVDYDYDPLGHLLRVAVSGGGLEVAYALDADARRTSRLVDGRLDRVYLHHERQLIAEVDPASGVTTVFVYAREEHSPDYLWRDGHAYLFVKDPVGSPRLVVDAQNGSIVQRLEYDPFGVVLGDSRPGFQPFGFAGGLWDPATGLTHFRHRDYDAALGRWVSRDPVLFLGGQLNLYAYAYNDPINHLDADGLQASGASGSSPITVTISLNPPPPPAGMDPGYSYLGYKVTLNNKVIVDERFGKRAPDECSVHIKSVTIVENSQMVGDILVTHYWGPPQIIINAPRR